MANMASGNTIAEVASLIGDPTRANMLAALMGGQLGAALLDTMLERKWVAHAPETRALRLTRAGESGFATVFRLPSGWREMGGL